MKRTGTVLLLALVTAASTASAQSSASYELSEHVLNSGGAPDGAALSSTSYTLSLVSIGESVADGNSPSSSSFGVSGGFVSAYPAPGEVFGLSFGSATTLSWDAEPSAGSYNLYRDLLSALPGLGYGGCEQPGLTATTTTDTDVAAAGNGYFYLVTVESRLHEEGTKGLGGAGERVGGVCP